MSVLEAMEQAGGFATRSALVAATSRQAVDSALAAGLIVADGRGRYATPATDAAVRAAHALSGVLTLTSAALHHGWEVLRVPELPHVAVARHRKVAPERRAGIVLHYAALDPADIEDGIVTGKETTLSHCMSQLPRPDALAVADSALRHGETPATLRRAALSVRGPGAPQARWVADHATGEAANPFESGLREVALDVPGLHVEVQVTLRVPGQRARPDLVDERLEIAIEADSFEWHGGRADLAKDARRYNLLVVDGWLVLRFAWEDVMFDRDYVRRVLVAAVALRSRRCRCGVA